MNLFQLEEKYEELKNAEDLDPKLLQDTLDSIKDTQEVKIDNIATMIKELKDESEALADKYRAFRDEAKYRKNKAEWLNQYLTNFLDSIGKTKMDTEHHILSTRNYRQPVVITDKSKIPEKYIKKTVDISYDTTSMYKDLKASGESTDYAYLKDNRKTVIK